MEKLITTEQARSFIFAGKAIFTIKSGESGKHFTYKITKGKRGNNPPHFASLLTGTDNNSQYSYFANIWDEKVYKHGAKSRITKDALGVQAFRWFFRNLLDGTLNGRVKIYHEGRCCKCGRRLTTPKSVERGIGPECNKMLSHD